MTLIKQNDIDAYLQNLQSICPKTILISGDSFLVRQALKRLTDSLLNENSGKFEIETLDGEAVSIGEIIEQTVTFSFMAKLKIIVVKNIPLFSATTSGVAAYTEKDCRPLTELMEKGIPDNHFLILTTQELNRRKKIFNSIQTYGLILDCTVPSGSRKADLNEQTELLRHIANKLTKEAGKTIQPKALQALADLIGFNSELFAINIEKLITYSGQRTEIILKDVMTVVKKEKKEPVFNLTNAVLDRNIANAFLNLYSLFEQQFHPLQILKSLENQIRKLLMVKYFVLSLPNSTSRLNRMNFDTFKHKIMPEVLKWDKRIQEQLSIEEPTFAKTKASYLKEKETKTSTDLLLAPTPQNVYALFQLFQKSYNFNLAELQKAIQDLADMNYELKKSTIDSHTKIEYFIISFCQKKGLVHVKKN